MIKYLLILVAAVVLTVGTAAKSQDIVVNSDIATKICSNASASVCGGSKDLGESKGFPFSFISSFDAQLDVESLKDVSSGFSIVNFVKSLGFWGVAAAAGYFVFTKLRNFAGSVVLIAAAAGAGLLYLGLIVI